MDTDAPSPNDADDRLPDEVRRASDTPDDRAAYAALWRMLGRTDDATDDAFSVDDTWDDIARQLDAPSDAEAAAPRARSDRAPEPRANQSARVARRWIALAAACLMMGAAALWWSRPVAIETVAGEQTTVSLPDGSTVVLNGATRLTYPRGFATLPFVDADARTVTLSGEAFFTVVSAERLFQIKTNNARVEVLGTEFNVQAYGAPNRPITEVALSSGRVRLQGQSPGHEPVVLSETGQYSRVDGTEAAPSAPTETSTETAAAWQEGGFAARNAPLPAILRALEAQFDTQIHLRVPESDTDAMTLYYKRAPDPEAILRDIVAVQGLQYRTLSQGYELVDPDTSSSESE